jgi:putative tryptophan/tyrosine transport system substrate-binding protein
MRRREFIAGLGGAAAVWPLAARAQQPTGMRRIGVLLTGAEDDPLYQRYIAVLREELQKLGWSEGRNLRVDVRFGDDNSNRVGAYAAELAGLAPDVIVASGSLQTKMVQQRTQTIPIVFVQVGDPVANGVVKSIARPEGNTTGITNLFPSIAGKWVELLKDAVPRIARVALVFDPELPATEIYMAVIEAAATAIAVKVIRTPVLDVVELERAIDAFAAETNGGLIVIPPTSASLHHRELIDRLAIRHRLPVIYADRFYAAEGGLMSYGSDSVDLYRRVASYVDRILRGAKPGDLPVEFPTKFVLVVNLKTAKAMGLEISPLLLLRADEVIE